MNLLHHIYISTYRQTTLLLLVIVALLSGCIVMGSVGGSRGQISFSDLKYPISMSPYIYGPSNEVISKGNGLTIIKQISLEKKSWDVFYTLIPLTISSNIVEAINKEITASSGDGIINVTFTTESGFLESIPVLTLLPVWPSYTKISIKGEIVKYDGELFVSRLPGTLETSRILINHERAPIEIIPTWEQRAKNQLVEHCKQTGRMETLTFKMSHADRGSIRKLSAEHGIREIKQYLERYDVLDLIYKRSAEKSANKVEIVDTDFVGRLYSNHNDATRYSVTTGQDDDSAVYVRYWSCPSNEIKK